ncbi:MAG: 1-deoxy-D-xylulose-5-phosphate reductoisomerase [FCB group bacterium]|nr:1-deoxy-D-xylulose-5-phosphate reductoisomerase [FCB group bacterium]
MKSKKLVILGSTGSIGKSTLEVIQAHPGRFDVVALAAHSNVDLLIKQYEIFKPEHLCLVNENKEQQLREQLKDKKVNILIGEKELLQLVKLDDVDIVVNAIVGASGLKASLETVSKGKVLALANKESLVCGGALFPPLVKKYGAKILPIDSEHSAIWQVLTCGKENEIKRLIITASGGPFRNLPFEKFSTIDVNQALHHPTWSMGPKITIDSATMVNKGLEIIEASVLFSIPTEKIKVVIHPQSIVHSMVEFIDSSIIAQLSRPDMKLPITYALFWPARVLSDFGELKFEQYTELTFEPPDIKKFRALKIAYEVAEQSGTAPAIFNAANEVAVQGFLDSAINFLKITDIIEDTLGKIKVVSQPNLDDILDADKQARNWAKKLLKG